MNREVYLLGGNIENHIWKFVCIVNESGELDDEAYFKFVDESNDAFYGLWGQGYVGIEGSLKNGSNSSRVETKIRRDKKNVGWSEPALQNRWNSETGTAAIIKRWMYNKHVEYTFKKMKIYGGVSDNEKSWIISLKIRNDAEKIYTYFEF